MGEVLVLAVIWVALGWVGVWVSIKRWPAPLNYRRSVEGLIWASIGGPLFLAVMLT